MTTLAYIDPDLYSFYETVDGKNMLANSNLSKRFWLIKYLEKGERNLLVVWIKICMLKVAASALCFTLIQVFSHLIVIFGFFALLFYCQVSPFLQMINR